MTQQEVMDILKEYGEATISEISEYTGCGSSAISENVRKCASQGYITFAKNKVGQYWIKKWRLNE